MNAARKVRLQNLDLECATDTCQSRIHTGCYLPAADVPTFGYYCSTCNVGYLCHVILMEKASEFNVGVYLRTQSVPADDNKFEDWCKECSCEFNDCTNENRSFGSLRLQEIGNIRLLADGSESQANLRVEQTELTWRVLYKTRCLLRYSLEGYDGVVEMQ